MADNYRVGFLGPARSEFGATLARLSGPNRLNALAAMASILNRLHLSPFDFGEELYDLKSLGMQVRIGIQLPFAISFGVDATNRIVIIQSVGTLG